MVHPDSLTMPPPSRVEASIDWSSPSSSHLHWEATNVSIKRSLSKTSSVPEMRSIMKNIDRSRGMLKRRWSAKADRHDLLNSLSPISLEAHQYGDIIQVMKTPAWSTGAERIATTRHALKRPLRTAPAPLSNLPKLNQSSPSLQIRRSSSILKCKSQSESIRSSYRPIESLNHLRSSSQSVTSISSTTSNVSFDRVSIREFPRCVGDNPSVKAGPPMSMGWDHQHQEEHCLDEYEKCRSSFKKDSVRRINGVERIEMLAFSWSASLEEMTKACEETEIIRRQRVETMTKSKSRERIEALLEKPKKIMKKVSFKKVFSKYS